jgi:trk system potassium uptake protein TrkA
MRLIIIGGNKTVYYLARQFVRSKHHVTIINRDQARSRELAEHTKATVVFGDGTNVGRLEEAGARQADVLLALTSHDQDNLIACQIARRNFGVPRTIALVNDPDNEDIFQRLGVTVAFSGTRIIGSLIEQETRFEDITALMTLAQGRVNVTDVRLDTESPAVGKTLLDLELSDHSLIACVIRNDEVIVPRGGTRLQVNDHLVLISQPQSQTRDLSVLCGIHV